MYWYTDVFSCTRPSIAIPEDYRWLPRITFRILWRIFPLVLGTGLW